MRNKDHCCVPKCNNNRSKVQSNITFHQFPKDKDLRRQWIIKIKRDGWGLIAHANTACGGEVTPPLRLCSFQYNQSDRHFLAGP